MLQKLLKVLVLFPAIALAQPAPGNKVDLYKYNGTTVGPTNPLDVKPGTGATFATSITEANQPFSAPKVNSALTPTEHIALMLATQVIGADNSETGTTTTTINATAHVARPGDIIEFISGVAANIGVINWVDTVSTNSFTVKFAFPSAPANGNTFNIRRQKDLVVTGNGTSIGHALYTALDSRYGSAATSLLHDSGTSSSVGDAGVKPLFNYQPADQEYAPETTTRNNYTGIQTDASGTLAVSIDGQLPGSFRGTICATSLGAGTPSTIVNASGSYYMYIRAISCRNSDTTTASELSFDFVGGGGAGTEIWNGGIAAFDNTGITGGTPGYSSGLIIPPLRGLVGDQFEFNSMQTGSVVCCADYYYSSY